MATLATIRAEIRKHLQGFRFTDADILEYLNKGINEVIGGIKMPGANYVTPPFPSLLTIADVYTVYNQAYLTLPTNYNRNLQFVANNSGVKIDIYPSFTNFSSYYPLLDDTGDVKMVAVQGKTNMYYQGNPTTRVVTSSTLTITASNDRITDSASELGDFSVGDYVTIGNSGESNDGTYLIDAVDSDGAYIEVTTSLSDETTPADMTLDKVERLSIQYYKNGTDLTTDSTEPSGIPEHLQRPILVPYVCKELLQFIQGTERKLKYYNSLFNKALMDLEVYQPVDGGSLFLYGENDHQYYSGY